MSFAIRARLVFIGLISAMLCVLLRLSYWQIGSADRLSALADAQHFSTFEIPAKRGEIRAFDGANLVTSINSNLLFANLTEIRSPPEEIAKTLAGLLAATDSSRLARLLSAKNVVWTALYHKIDDQTKQKISGLKIPGLEFALEPARFYPEASMSAQLLGIVGADQNGNPKGYFGLEGFYERELAGRPGLRRVEQDALGKPIAIGSDTAVPPEDGRTLVTSLDRYIQNIATTYLEDGLKTWGASSGSVVVVNPQNGEILAMVSLPTFDPGNFGFYPAKLYQNPVISEAFEPGSIFKPLIMAAALNENKVTPATKCDRCLGPRVIDGGVIRTFNDQYHPETTMTEVLENSDNTGMVFVGEKLGRELLFNYLNRYQFGKKTGIDLEGEETGLLKTASQWYPLDLATVTFGQGIAVTPIQMVRAFSAIANGGYLVNPHVVTRFVKGERVIPVDPKTGSRILSFETSKTVTRMLVGVTEKSPLHFPRDRVAGLEKFKIAAKSGTAQIPISGHYEQAKTIGSVIGFAPADNPKFLILVKLDEPSVRPWGSDTAGPIFYNLVHDLLLYYGVSP